SHRHLHTYPTRRSSDLPAIRRVHELIDRVAETDADVLILGENGTGKEVVARAVHRKSLRKNNVFMSVDLGALTESLFESELFGYVKGAFTDARQDKAGRIEAARSEERRVGKEWRARWSAEHGKRQREKV